MLHEKIDLADAIPVLDARPVKTASNVTVTAAQPLDRGARFYAALIVFGLPLILLYLLARFVWNDTKAVARGIAIFYRGVAEELSR